MVRKVQIFCDFTGEEVGEEEAFMVSYQSLGDGRPHALCELSETGLQWLLRIVDRLANTHPWDHAGDALAPARSDEPLRKDVKQLLRETSATEPPLIDPRGKEPALKRPRTRSEVRHWIQQQADSLASLSDIEEEISDIDDLYHDEKRDTNLIAAQMEDARRRERRAKRGEPTEDDKISHYKR